jgi:lysophospholipase L1-like esterase
VKQTVQTNKQQATSAPGKSVPKPLRAAWLVVLVLSTILALCLCLETYVWVQSAQSRPKDADEPMNFREFIKFVAGVPTPDTMIPTDRPDVWTWMPRHDALVERAKKGNVGVMFIGDSITEAMTSCRPILQRYFGKMNPDAFGIGGDRTQHLLWRLQHGELNGVKPRVAVVLIGTNNISAGDKNAAIVHGVEAVLNEVRLHTPSTKIVLMGLLPRGPTLGPVRKRIDGINAGLQKLADNKHVWYTDPGRKLLRPDGSLPQELMPDFLHPSEKGYELIFDQIKPLIGELYEGSQPQNPVPDRSPSSNKK